MTLAASPAGSPGASPGARQQALGPDVTAGSSRWPEDVAFSCSHFWGQRQKSKRRTTRKSFQKLHVDKRKPENFSKESDRLLISSRRGNPDSMILPEQFPH